MRRAARIDANQPEIITALRLIGCRVLDLSKVGEGVPDLLVGRRNRWILIEVKNPDAKPGDRVLTPAQVKFHAEHSDLPVFVVETEQQAIEVVLVNAP